MISPAILLAKTSRVLGETDIKQHFSSFSSHEYKAIPFKEKENKKQNSKNQKHNKSFELRL
jgi:hypothetical protein